MILNCLSFSYFQPGYTPLLIACRHQKTDIVKYFAGIDGVDFSACCESSRNNEDGQKGITGLHLAAIHDSPEIARLLIEKKCPVLTQNEKVCLWEPMKSADLWYKDVWVLLFWSMCVMCV